MHHMLINVTGFSEPKVRQKNEMTVYYETHPARFARPYAPGPTPLPNNASEETKG